MRRITSGINWIFYHADTLEDAVAWFIELKGVEPYASTIWEDRDGTYCFRLHR